MRLFFFLNFFFFPLILFCQSPVQTLKGLVRDADTQNPIAFAKVVLTSEQPIRGVITDEAGRFVIENVPVGRHEIEVTFIGYTTRVIPNLIISSGKEFVITIFLTESFLEGKTVEINADQEKGKPVNDLSMVSARSFSVEETQRYAASLNDPGRMASAFAGVQPSSDGRNNIVIRGNSPAGMLWRLEGVDIPNPNHFASPGSSGGGISIISNYLLDNSDFLTGAFPAEYGNALSGVFDLRLRNGNDEKHEFGFQAGFLGVQASAEGPLTGKQKGSYLVNYRYSTLGLMQAFGLPIVQDATYSYQDVNFHFNFSTQKAGSFGFFGLGGLSSQTAKAERDSTVWQNVSDKSDHRYGSNMGATGVSHSYLFPSGKTWLRSVISLSSNHIFGNEDTLNSLFQKTNLEKNAYLTGQATFTSTVNHKFNNRHLIRSGFFLDYLFFDLSASYLNIQTATQIQAIKTIGGATLLRPYFHYRWRIADNVSLNAGIHSMVFLLNKSWTVEPRLACRWNFSQKQSLSFGYGLHSQILPLGTYFSEIILSDGTRVQPNLYLRMMQAHHFVLSHDWQFNSQLRLKSEVYIQRLFNVPIGTSTRPTLSVLNTDWGFEGDSLVGKGNGLNYGFELTFEKFFSKNYYFLTTLSLYESKYKAADGVLRDSRFNGNYAFNFLAGKDIPIGKRKAHFFEISGRLVWLGGQRYTPIDLQASIAASRTQYMETFAFQFRKKDYFRTDLRLAYHLNKKKTGHVFSFDVQNLFNTRNDFVQEFEPSSQSIKEYYQAGFVPIFAYRLDF